MIKTWELFQIKTFYYWEIHGGEREFQGFDKSPQMCAIKIKWHLVTSVCAIGTVQPLVIKQQFTTLPWYGCTVVEYIGPILQDISTLDQ